LGPSLSTKRCTLLSQTLILYLNFLVVIDSQTAKFCILQAHSVERSVINAMWPITEHVKTFLVEIHLQFLHIIHFATHWQLYDKTARLSTDFFHKILHPSSCLHYLLPKKDTTAK